jgi:hypothetical protein
VSGLSLRGDLALLPAGALLIRDNLLADHMPPLASYVRSGVGRGATSVVGLDMRDNWWNSPDGPYHPLGNPQGHGDAVGVNIDYLPWLTSRPACAPQP